MNKQLHLLPYFAGIIISFIFGFSFLFTKESLATMAPFELLAHRFSLATLLLIGLIGFKLIKVRFNLKLLRDLLPLALLQPFIYFLGETFGIQLTSATESGLIISLIPVAVSLMAKVFLKEQFGWRQLLLVFLSVLGVFLIVLSGSGLKYSAHTSGIISLIVAVMAAAFYNIFARKLSIDYTPIEITTVMMIVGAVFFNLLWVFSMKPNTAYFGAFMNRKSVEALIYLGIFCSVGAFFLMNYMLKKIPAFQAATFVNLTTIVSVIAGVIFRHESFGIIHIIGGSFIIIGVWGVNFPVYKGTKQ